MKNHILLSPIQDIEGIGEKYGAMLNELGIKTPLDLILPRAEHALRLSEVPAGLAQKWISHAWLLTIPEVTPDIAECMVDEGITTVEELGNRGLSTIEKMMQAGREKNKTNEEPSLYKLAEIQKDAIRAHRKGLVCGRISDRATGAPVAHAEVYCGDTKTETDEKGRFVFTGVHAGKHKLNIMSDTHMTVLVPVEVKERQISQFRNIQVGERTKPPKPPKAEHQGLKFKVTTRDVVKTRDKTLADLPNETYLLVQRFYKNGNAALTHLFRTKTQNSIWVDVIKVPKDSIPGHEELNEQDVLEYKDGTLQKSSLTKRQLQRKRLEMAYGPIKSIKVKRKL